jgi:hypothetical protein
MPACLTFRESGSIYSTVPAGGGERSHEQKHEHETRTHHPRRAPQLPLQMNHSSVLIVGASYGGLTLARCLRTYGVDCGARILSCSMLYCPHILWQQLFKPFVLVAAIYLSDTVVLECRESLLHERDRGCGLWNKAQVCTARGCADSWVAFAILMIALSHIFCMHSVTIPGHPHASIVGHCC